MKVFIFAILIASTFAGLVVDDQTKKDQPAPATPVSKYQCLRNILNFGLETEQKAIGVRGSYDIKTLLTYIDNMPQDVQDKVKACGLNLSPALARCESAYGKGNCEQISASSYQTKCDQLFQRTGCCHCAMQCPVGYTEDDYHCIKPEHKTLAQYKDEETCKKTEKTCVQRGSRWTGECGIGYGRLGVSICKAICPFGWHDEGKRCRKPADYRMAQPFLWQRGDN